MINSIAPYHAPNVPKRDVIAPVEAIACVELNPYFSRNEYKKHEKPHTSENIRFGSNYQNFSPLFAIHVLVEAGEAENKDQMGGIGAYNRRNKSSQNLIAIA